MEHNGHEAPPSLVQINPLETARVALMFLARCDLKPAERPAFAHAELLLQAIANGKLHLVEPGAVNERPLAVSAAALAAMDAPPS